MVANLAAIVNPSSSSLNGQGTWQAGRLRFGVVEATQCAFGRPAGIAEGVHCERESQLHSGTITGAFLAERGDAERQRDRRRATERDQTFAPLCWRRFHEQRASMTGDPGRRSCTLAGRGRAHREPRWRDRTERAMRGSPTASAES